MDNSVPGPPSASPGPASPKLQSRQIKEVLPKHGLVYSERGSLTDCFVLCKPKILPLKSAVLEQLQKIEQAVEAEVEEAEGKSAEGHGGLYRDR